MCAHLLLNSFCQSRCLRSIFCKPLFRDGGGFNLVLCTTFTPFFVPGFFVRMWWQEERKTEARGTSASLLQQSHRRLPAQAPGVAVKAAVHPPTRMNATVGIASLHRGCLQALQPLPHHDERIPTTPNVQLPPGISSPPASDVDCPASVLSTALCDFVPTMRSHRIVRTTATGVTPGAPTSLASPAGATLSFLTFQRLRADSRIPGWFAPPFTWPCVEVRSAQPAAD